ncbi:bifunctional glutamate--cysteine ligase glutathione synthetase [Liquorilactobacillus aquaticus DSM 21051]|uniref:Bifunctional glutamate--cysteine ligase glutathione synthetase n=1 Tax=Liquorilactobacillus aquaticus DSM 21051 TaxID=1423725 RepID=A0A0R2D1F3_9LACO|nr:hypothetical protein [Liquorilactobacillus aquaticus]KRM97541.1 bifunctional glutamate--cysteine ligase glutathione synthetase [Liquorilactobacillus aquaticus DSM 21051]
MVELDEIGKQIVKNNFSAAFKAVGWQIDRTWKVSSMLAGSNGIDKKRLENIKSSEYFEFNAINSSVSLSSEKWYSKKSLREKMILNQYLLQENMAPEDALWPLSIVKKESNLNCLGGLKIRIQLPEDLLIGLYKNKFKQLKIDYIVFRNQVYMKLLQQFASHRWLLTYLTGATPFVDGAKTRPTRSQSECHMSETMNLADQVAYGSLKDYLKNVQHEQAGLVDGIKVGSSLKTESEMLEKGIHYLEISHFDLDPFSTLGVSDEIMDLLEALTAFFIASPGIKNENLQDVLKESRQLNQQVARENPFATSVCQLQAQKLINKLKRFVKEVVSLGGLEPSLNKLAILCNSSAETSSTKLLRAQGSDLAENARQLALNNKISNTNILSKTALNTVDLNSRLVLDSAFKLGVPFEIISLSDNLIKVGNTILDAGIQTEASSAIMQKLWADRELTKKLAAAAGFNVPTGWTITNIAETEAVYQEVQGLIIAMKNTHFEGTRVFRIPPTRSMFIHAVKKYLTPKFPCLVEQAIVGSNYTALLVGGRVVSLVERIPQNIVGDGHSSIEQLVKNKKAKRENLQSSFDLGKLQEETLKEQGRTSSDILPRGVQLYLRYDASRGTGADHLEVLDEVDNSYLKKIEELAKILKMSDGGIDVIISNIYQPLVGAGEENQFVFLNAHAFPCLSAHEITLLNRTQHIADSIVRNAVNLSEQTS